MKAVLKVLYHYRDIYLTTRAISEKAGTSWMTTRRILRTLDNKEYVHKKRRKMKNSEKGRTYWRLKE